MFNHKQKNVIFSDTMSGVLYARPRDPGLADVGTRPRGNVYPGS